MNEKLKELVKQAGFIDADLEVIPEELDRFAELVRQDERELCAKLCENVSELTNRTFQGVAAAIRGRTE
jgi:hypothetical protein